jgi:hypothetical protein
VILCIHAFRDVRRSLIFTAEKKCLVIARREDADGKANAYNISSQKYACTHTFVWVILLESDREFWCAE